MSANSQPETEAPPIKTELRIYRVCSFKPGAVVPKVELIGATCDKEALLVAGTIDLSADREVWDRHRLVAKMPAVSDKMVLLTAAA